MFCYLQFIKCQTLHVFGNGFEDPGLVASVLRNCRSLCRKSPYIFFVLFEFDYLTESQRSVQYTHVKREKHVVHYERRTMLGRPVRVAGLQLFRAGKGERVLKCQQLLIYSLESSGSSSVALDS